jgi:hypothetical protein
VPHRLEKISIDRLDQFIKRSGSGDLRSIYRVLLEEDWGDGHFPQHRDIQKVGDLLRIGADGLSIRFRDVDPLVWGWLLDELEELR